LAILPVYFFSLTVSHRILRFLMLWSFVALQALTPFIHAHAGPVRLDQAGFLHLHQGVHGDASCNATVTDERGAEIVVEQGVRLRNTSPDAVANAPAVAATPFACAFPAARRGADLPILRPLALALAEHILPPALAPPAA
jgi:hypothetical protein